MSLSSTSSSIKAPYLIYFGDVTERAYAKTGLGLIAWRPERCLGQLCLPACTIDAGLPDMSIASAARHGAKSLVLGVAPSGGSIPEEWLFDIVSAARAGLDIVSGMHSRLNTYPDIVAAARESGAELIDVRVPPATLSIGTGAKRPGLRLLTVGTDCAVGKKYTALAIEFEMRRRGWRADFRASGQTGIMIAGSGIPIDSVVSDFLSGAAESISPAASSDHWDVIEGQGSLSHPSFAGVSLGLLHGSQPDALVLCHDAVRYHMVGLGTAQQLPVPSLSESIDLNLSLARRVNDNCRFVGIAVNSSTLSKKERTRRFSSYREETGLPVVDPMIDGVGAIVDQIKKDFL